MAHFASLLARFDLGFAGADPRLLTPLLACLLLTSALATACGGDTSPSPSPAPSRTTARTELNATVRGFTAATLHHFRDSDVDWYGGSGAPGRHVEAALSFAEGAALATLYVSADRSIVDLKSYRCGVDSGYVVEICYRGGAATEEVLLSRVKGQRPTVIARRLTTQETITILAWPGTSPSVRLPMIRDVLSDPAIGLAGSLTGNRAGEALTAFHQLRGGDSVETVPAR